MINDRPMPLRCAVCDRTGPLALFVREGEIINWVMVAGKTYVVCRDHISSVVLDESSGQPRFSSAPTPYELEKRIASLERRCDFYDNNGDWNR